MGENYVMILLLFVGMNFLNEKLVRFRHEDEIFILMPEEMNTGSKGKEQT